MKKLIIPSIILFIGFACSSDDPKPAECQPTVIEDFDQTSTFYYFEDLGAGFNKLSSISVYDGTDSAYMHSYEYADNLISKITVSNNSNINYAATYDGDRLTTLSGTPQGSGVVTNEDRLVYSGSNVVRWETYIAEPTSGTLYQYFHYEYTYNDGELTAVEYYFDFTTIFTLLFGGVPSGYAPEHIFTNEFSYGNQGAPNPLYKQYNTLKPEMAFMMNVPTTLVQKDLDGNILGSRGYDLTFNEQGFPTLANAGNAFIDYSYDCN